MYIPAQFAAQSQESCVAFMRQYPFAALVSTLATEQGESRLFATHLPFIVEEVEAGGLRVVGHLAKNNPHAAVLEGQEVLVIFSEPHAYISPGLYEQSLNVPTWNYVAVHVYGRVRLIEGEEAGFALLEKQIDAYEAAYKQQWADLPLAYKQAMLKGVVCFEIDVQQLEGKYKLSQNKSEQDRRRVTEHLLHSEDGAAKSIGAMMHQGLD